MIYSREEILAARAEMPQAWKRTARWRMGSEIDTVETSEAVGLSNGGFDWSSQTALGASYADFDAKALAFARSQMEARMGARASRLKGISTESLMSKMGAMVNGVPTHGALLFLGKASSDAHMAGLAPRIVFTRYNDAGQLQQRMNVRMPYALSIPRLVEGICAGSDYPEQAVQELLVNAVAHCDYLARANIEVRDYDGQLSVTNPGGWVKGSPSAALRQDFDPTPMRNAALCRLMTQSGMMDALGLGVACAQAALRERRLPALSYDLSAEGTVTALLYASEAAAQQVRTLPEVPTSAPGTEKAAEAKAGDGAPASTAASTPTPAHTAAKAGRPASGAAPAMGAAPSSEELKAQIIDIIKGGHGLTRAEVVDELNDRGIAGTGEKFARRVGRLLDQLHKAGRIRKGQTDKRHWYPA